MTVLDDLACAQTAMGETHDEVDEEGLLAVDQHRFQFGYHL